MQALGGTKQVGALLWPDKTPDNAGRLLSDCLNTGRADILISNAELAERRIALEAAGGYAYPASQTPWQEIQRGMVGQLETGAVLEPAVKYHRIVDRFGLPRNSH